MPKRSAKTAESFTEPGESTSQRIAVYEKETQDNSEWKRRPKKRRRSGFNGLPKIKTEHGNDRSTAKGISQDELNWKNEIAIRAVVSNNPECKVTVRNYDVKIQDKPTTVDESCKRHLAFRAPQFRASSKIEMAPLSEGEKWRVGWIQACTDNFYRMSYGNKGCCMVDCPELRTGEQAMVNDSVGNHYPWYQHTVTFTGPCSHQQSETITMSDTLGGTADYRYSKLKLTNISRYNSFNVWHVAWDMTSGKAYILKTFCWDQYINIDIDVKMPRGQRTKVTSNLITTQPKQVENIPIPICALSPPNANRAFSVFFCPKVGECECIVPPSWKKNVSAFKQIDGNKFDFQLCRL